MPRADCIARARDCLALARQHRLQGFRPFRLHAPRERWTLVTPAGSAAMYLTAARGWRGRAGEAL